MTSRVSSQHNAVPISKLLAVETQVGKLSSEMEKLILISTQHGMRIKELIVASSNSVSQVDMMSAVTTARFQHINDLKALRSNLQMKFEQSQPGAAEGIFTDDAESKELKAMSCRLLELESEASNAKFKHGMELNKLKIELKDSKKDFDELKRFVSILESKLGSFIQDAKDNGIKTNIEMDDMPEIAVFPSTSASRRASIFSSDNPLEVVEEETASAAELTEPMEPTDPAVSISSPSEKADLQPNAHNLSHSTINTEHTQQTLQTDQSALDPPHLTPSAIPPQTSAHHQHLQQLQQQQVQLMHYRDQVSAHSSYSQIYGVPISDSGMSSHTASHANLPPTFNSSCYGGHPHYPYHNHYSNSSEEMQLVSNYGKPILSREERHYRNQFKAVKELILATMDCKDIATLEPEGLNGVAGAGTGVNEEASVVEVKDSEKEAILDGSAAGTDGAAVKPVLHTINLRHRNRDLFYNMQKVKDVEKIALNYADFCVNNAVNVIDSAAYDKFQATLFASELDRFHSKAASLHSVEVQTDIPTIHHPYPSSGFTTHNPSVNNSPDVNIRKSSVFGTSGKLTTGRKRGDSILLRSQSERVRTPNTNDTAAHKVVRVSTSRNSDTADTLGFSRPTSAFNTDSVNPDTIKPDATKDVTAEVSVKSSQIERPMSASEKEYTRVRTPVDTSPRNMLVALKQLREEAALEAEDDDGLAALTEMELPPSAPLLDFGDILLPTLYSSTGRRQSLSLVNPIKAQTFRDPALDFLDIQDANAGENEDEPLKDTYGPGLLLAAKTPSFRNSFLARKDSFSANRPGTGGSMKGNAEFNSHSSSNTPVFHSPQSIKHKTLANLSNNAVLPNTTVNNGPNVTINVPKVTSSGIPFSDTITSNVISDEDVGELKEELKILMDKKMLVLYTALDNRWQGLDSTNTSILHKLNRFQEVIVVINEDNQRILGLNQALAVRMNKVESRMYEALEPVYIALQHNRDGVENLEALMVEVAEKLEGVSEKENKTVPTTLPNPQLLPKGMVPNPQLPIESLLRGNSAGAGATYAASATLNTTSVGPGEYHVDEVLAPRAASAMSEYELDSVFKQLREYSSLYKDMLINYNHLLKRLKEEDARKSGNFALRKPHLSGTVEVTNPNCEFCLPNNNMEDAYRAESSHILPSSADLTNPREPDGQNSRFPQSFPSPHRVIVPVGINGSSMVNKRDIQLCVEKSDLSANIEIVRMKNDIARLSHALGIRDTSPSRQRGPLPPTTFPSLFSSLGNGEFAVLSTHPSQQEGPSVLSYLPPTSPSSRVLRSSGGTRYSAEPNAQGLFIAPSGRPQQRIPLEFSLNDELNSLSLGEDGQPSVLYPNANPSIPSVQNDLNGPSVHSVSSANELFGSSHNSILHTIRSTPDGYSIGGAEQDVGLDTHSLSPYEFLLNPRIPDGHEASMSTVEPADGAGIFDKKHSITDPSAKVITPGAVPARPAVTIIHAPAEVNAPAQHNTPSRPKSRSVMWGSSTSIHANLNPLQKDSNHISKLSSSSGKERSPTSTIRKAVVNNVPTPSPATIKRKVMPSGAISAQMRDSSDGPSVADSIRKMDVIQRADEIIHANQFVTGPPSASASAGNVRTGLVSKPKPPVMSRPMHTNQYSNASAHHTASTRNITSNQPPSHPTSTTNPTSNINEGDMSAVWRYNHHDSNVGNDVAATPSILLQPGEYIPPGPNFPTDTSMAPHHATSLLRSREMSREQHGLNGGQTTVSSLETDSVVGGAFVE